MELRHIGRSNRGSDDEGNDQGIAVLRISISIVYNVCSSDNIVCLSARYISSASTYRLFVYLLVLSAP